MPTGIPQHAVTSFTKSWISAANGRHVVTHGPQSRRVPAAKMLRRPPSSGRPPAKESPAPRLTGGIWESTEANGLLVALRVCGQTCATRSRAWKTKPSSCTSSHLFRKNKSWASLKAIALHRWAPCARTTGAFRRLGRKSSQQRVNTRTWNLGIVELSAYTDLYTRIHNPQKPKPHGLGLARDPCLRTSLTTCPRNRTGWKADARRSPCHALQPSPGIFYCFVDLELSADSSCVRREIATF